MSKASQFSVTDFVAAALNDEKNFVDTVEHFGVDSPKSRAYAEFGVGFGSAVCHTQAEIDELEKYRSQIQKSECATWMDNTSLLTATVLLTNSDGPEAITPLTIWDLTLFAQCLICYDKIYHHNHAHVADQEINNFVGDDVMQSIPLPVHDENDILPENWGGVHRWMCELWSEGRSWLKNLHDSVGKDTLENELLKAIHGAWKNALGRDDFGELALVDYGRASTRWTSPSNTLLAEMFDATSISETRQYLDVTPSFRRFNARIRELGMEDESEARLNELLTDTNLRSFINQRLADFFQVSYSCSLARVPFRKHLYDRSVAVRDELMSIKAIEARYEDISDVQFRLPAILAVASDGCQKPEDLWNRLSELRRQALPFRKRRKSLDAALLQGDLSEAKKLASALKSDLDSILKVAGDATIDCTTKVVEHVVKGNVSATKMAIAGLWAAAKKSLQSSYAERLLNRVLRPDLFFLTNTFEQSQRITNAMPQISKIWDIPEKYAEEFVRRTQRMQNLAS